MQTRKQLAEEYTINSFGNITSPGKFEGEALYVPYLYEQGLDGGADDSYNAYEWEDSEDDDECPPQVDVFYLTDEDRRQFPELRPFKCACLFESEQGFVSCELHTAEEWETFRKTVGL